VNYLKELLDQIGLGGERLEMYFLSSAEGARFAELATEMTERIRRLGPNPLVVEEKRYGGTPPNPRPDGGRGSSFR
jgi:coenzyme F420-reducing hydrogenase delta subunit